MPPFVLSGAFMNTVDIIIPTYKPDISLFRLVDDLEDTKAVDAVMEMV